MNISWHTASYNIRVSKVQDLEVLNFHPCDYYQGSHRPGKVLEFDHGPGKLLEFEKNAFCPGIVLELCKLSLKK